MTIPKVGRVPALQACLDNGWTKGTQLVSQSWKIPRKILGHSMLDDLTNTRRSGRPLPNLAIGVALIKEDGDVLREEFLYTFPDDVQRAPDTA